MHHPHRRRFVPSLALAVAFAAGCSPAASTHDPFADQPETVGSVGLELTVAPGITVNSLNYSITGPQSYSGTLNVASASTLSAVLSPIAAGTGYSLTISGTATDGATTCNGSSATFGVTAKTTTTVTIAVTCKQPATTGSVLVSGTINVCAQIDSVSANPPSGTTIALFSSAHDADAAPQPVTYHWTTSSGTLSDASAQSPTLSCTQPGTVNLTVTVTDGDPACSDTFTTQVVCPPDSALNDPAWIELGNNNQAIARLVTPYTVCPSITVDGTTSAMSLRVGPGTIPLRGTNSDPTPGPSVTNSKASAFPVSTCEFNIPAGAHTATVAGKSLPLPRANVQRIVVIGDTGCRISIGNPYQACGDPSQWPFPVISSVAAKMNPDLVLHVGDYQYRDNPCPPDQPQCAGTPWGYGYDTWYADLFQPAAPLLAAAPWIMVRGNHETCNRAGQGWYRFLDINPYSDARSCNADANDSVANYNDPWAVTVDGDTQFIAFDSANTPKTALASTSLGFMNYSAELDAAATFAASPNFLTIFAVHHPILGYTPVAGAQPTGGNPGMLSVMGAKYPTAYYPAGVALAMHGHVHDFQGISFASAHPATFVAGHGGDNLDPGLPASITAVPATGTTVGQIAYSTSFGFMVMDRIGPKNWTYTAYKVDGTVLTQCTQTATTTCTAMSCDPNAGAKQITCSPFGSLM